MSLYINWGKRIFDFAVSLVILIALFPVLILLVIAIRIKLGKGCIFKQERSGYRGKIFIIYKFRTMKTIYDAAGKLLPDEKRMTKFGNFLRNMSLDELPGLINVLKGDMSLVGPRPFIKDYFAHYTPPQARRLLVKPGITGWAQIKGRNALNWEEKFKLDVWYVDNLSFILDMKILLLTPFAVFNQKNINADGHATMPRFIAMAENDVDNHSTDNG